MPQGRGAPEWHGACSISARRLWMRRGREPLIDEGETEMIPSLPHRSSLMRASVVALAVLAPLGEAAAETKVKPGFNVFSVQQDIEIGRQSAAEAERQLRM